MRRSIVLAVGVGIILGVFATVSIMAYKSQKAGTTEPDKIIISQKDGFDTKKAKLELMGENLAAYSVLCHAAVANESNKDIILNKANGFLIEEGNKIEAWIKGKNKESEVSLLINSFSEGIGSSIFRSAKEYIIESEASEPGVSRQTVLEQKCKKSKAEYERFVLE